MNTQNNTANSIFQIFYCVIESNAEIGSQRGISARANKFQFPRK